VPTANPGREILATALSFDVTTFAATATITIGPSSEPGATLEVGDLVLDSVQVGGVDLAYAPRLTQKMTMHVIDLALDPSDRPTTVTFGLWPRPPGPSASPAPAVSDLPPKIIKAAINNPATTAMAMMMFLRRRLWSTTTKVSDEVNLDSRFISRILSAVVREHRRNGPAPGVLR